MYTALQHTKTQLFTSLTVKLFISCKFIISCEFIARLLHDTTQMLYK